MVAHPKDSLGKSAFCSNRAHRHRSVNPTSHLSGIDADFRAGIF